MARRPHVRVAPPARGSRTGAWPGHPIPRTRGLHRGACPMSRPHRHRRQRRALLLLRSPISCRGGNTCVGRHSSRAPAIGASDRRTSNDRRQPVGHRSRAVRQRGALPELEPDAAQATRATCSKAADAGKHHCPQPVALAHAIGGQRWPHRAPDVGSQHARARSAPRGLPFRSTRRAGQAGSSAVDRRRGCHADRDGAKPQDRTKTACRRRIGAVPAGPARTSGHGSRLPHPLATNGNTTGIATSATAWKTSAIGAPARRKSRSA